MTFNLPDSLRTGFPEIDEDHEVLISRLNMIDRAERSGDPEKLLARLHDLRAELVGHFHTEEAILREAGYPEANGHAEHHAEIIASLENLIRDFRAGQVRGGIAETCFRDLVSVLLTRDMEFHSWLADRRTGA